jgi:hypothetical protein
VRFRIDRPGQVPFMADREQRERESQQDDETKFQQEREQQRADVTRESQDVRDAALTEPDE